MKDYSQAIRVADRLVAWKMIDRACDLLERCLDQAPANPELLRRLGHIKLAQGRPREAAPLLEQAVAHDRMMQPMRES